MSLNALLGLEEVDPFFDEEVLQEGYYSNESSEESLAGSFEQFEAVSMEGVTGEDCELLLTDYLLNFGEESGKECPYDGFSSGVECSDNEEDDRPLATLKKSLEKTKKDCSVTGKISATAEKGKESCKDVSSSVPLDKNGKEKNFDSFEQFWEEKISERKARDRARSKNNRAKNTQKVKDLQKECDELKTNNKVLSEKNTAFNEKISSLEEQVEYLESVIANESALSAILKTLTGNSGLEFQKTPLIGLNNSMKRKREENVDHDESDAKKKSGGVCLHLTPGRMSLEFCWVCQKNSTKTVNEHPV